MASQVSTRNDPLSLLRRLLIVDAVLSGVCGLVLILGAGPVAGFTGVDAPLAFAALGAILLGWAAVVWRIASRLEQDVRQALIVPILNIAWVVSGGAILAGGWVPLTTGGAWASAIIDLVVLDLALLQFYALRRADRAQHL